MKKQLAKLAFTATLGLALTFTACEEKKKQDGTTATEPAAAAETQEAAVEKATVATHETGTVCDKGGGVKLLESSTDDEGRVHKFEYDKQNRIVKHNFKYPVTGSDNIMTITYNSDDLVTVEIVNNSNTGNRKWTDKYVRNGNTITYEDGRFAPEKETFTINKEGYIFRQGYEYKDGNLIKTEDWDQYNIYDDKKSPFSNTNTPKWLLQTLFYMFNPNKNNVLEKHEDNGEGNGDFNYKYEYDGDGFPIKETKDGTIIRHFTYLCGTKN